MLKNLNLLYKSGIRHSLKYQSALSNAISKHFNLLIVVYSYWYTDVWDDS